MAPTLVHASRRNAKRSPALLALAAAALSVAAVAFFGQDDTFVGLPPSARSASAVARYAEAEDVPTDVALAEEGGSDATPWRKCLPKREVRGTLCYARRELNEEAQRMRPYLEPLLEKQLSIKEITFVLNRMGSKLRPLLYRPRLGLPIFTEHKVRRLLRRAVTPKGRLIKFVRPQHLPPNAPGAAYPDSLEDAYAEVPPLKPWP